MAQEKPVEFWTTHSLEKVFPGSRTPPVGPWPEDRIELRAARNETEDAQVVIIVPPGREIAEASFQLDSLQGPDGSCIDAGQLSAHWEWFTWVTHNPPGNSDPGTYLRRAPAFFPDGFLEQKTIRILDDRAQPLWFSVHVPPDAPAGTYEGELTIHLVDKQARSQQLTVPIALHVWPFVLPKEGHLRHTEWFNEMALTDYHRLEPWSEEHWGWIEKVARDMADHRQDMIRTSFRSLVDVTRCSGGGYEFDFSRLDRWIETFRKAGVPWIEGGHIAGRTGGWDSDIGLARFPVRREGGGQVDTSRKAMDEAEFEEIVEALLKAVHAHLKQKGWDERYVQHIADEPVPANMDSWQRIARKVAQWLPGVPRIDAIMSEGLEGDIELRVPQIQELHEPSRREPPEQTWCYVCLAPQGRYPNRFLDYASIRNRIIFWLCWSLNLKGFLHWGYNHWTPWGGCPARVRLSPWTDATGGSVYCQDDNPLPAGDPFIVYPGEEQICSSVRWEVIRKGMEDYEYLHLLAELVADARPGPERERGELLLQQVRREVAPDPACHTRSARLLLTVREQIGDVIAALIGEGG